MARRLDLALDAIGPFISRLRGEALSQPWVRELLLRPRDRARRATRVHAMRLRHLCAAEMAHTGAPTEIILAHLGHTPRALVARSVPQPDRAALGEVMRCRSRSSGRDPRHHRIRWCTRAGARRWR